MKTFEINQFEIIHLRLPMKFTFTTSFGDIAYRETVIVKLTTNTGVVGYGESAALTEPVYLEESIGTVKEILKNVLKPVVVNKSISPQIFYDSTNYIRGNRLAKYGVECALWAIASQLEQKPVVSLLGGKRKKIKLGESIGILPTIKDTLCLIDKRINQGYHRIKVKVKPGWDIKLVAAIRKEFPHIVLSVDANSAYSLAEVDIFKKLDEYNLLMIEQPLEYDDIYYHSRLQKEIRTPICLDESIISFEKAKKAIEMKACGIINVKPGRIGSLIETVKINQLAKENNIPLWCGGMLETGVAKAFNIFAASLSEFSLPADISPSSIFFNQDIISPEIYMSNSGYVDVPRVLGIGFDINQNIIDKYRV